MMAIKSVYNYLIDNSNNEILFFGYIRIDMRQQSPDIQITASKETGVSFTKFL